MNLRKAAEMALEYLTYGPCAHYVISQEMVSTLREALAQPEQEPVAWMVHGGEIWNTSVSPYRDERGIPLYLHPAPNPEGWQLVPKNPTDEMLDAAEEVKQYELGTPRMRWEAMLAAAPKPE